MKSLIFAVLLLPALPLHAAPASTADFPLTAHVVYASFPVNQVQRIDAMIDGQQMELSTSASGLLKLGDYPARISPRVKAPKNWSVYDQYIGYDLLMPDGKVRTYVVVGMGVPIEASPAGNP